MKYKHLHQDLVIPTFVETVVFYRTSNKYYNKVNQRGNNAKPQKVESRILGRVF